MQFIFNVPDRVDSFPQHFLVHSNAQSTCIQVDNKDISKHTFFFVICRTNSRRDTCEHIYMYKMKEAFFVEKI